MDRSRHYFRCKIAGHGRLYRNFDKKGIEFSVVDMSATGLKIITRAELEEKEEIRLDIRFSGFIFEVAVSVKGRVTRKAYLGEEAMEYGLHFVDLPHKDRVEIDEMIGHSCTLNYNHNG